MTTALTTENSLLNRFFAPGSYVSHMVVSRTDCLKDHSRWVGVSSCGNHAYLRCNHTPLEDIVLHQSWRACRISLSDKKHGAAYGEAWEWDEKNARAYLAKSELHRPMELQYWVLRSSSVFLEAILASVEDIESHIWRWMMLGHIREESFLDDCLRMMNKDLSRSLMSFRQNALAIQAAAKLLDDPVALETLKATHKAIHKEHKDSDEAMESMARLFDEAMPGSLSGLLTWLKALNGFRKQLGMRMIPTPFGIQIASRKMVKQSRRVVVKALNTFSLFATSDQIEKAKTGEQITIPTNGGSLEFRMSVDAQSKVIFHDNKRLLLDRIGSPFPNIEVHSGAGEYLGKLCVYAEDTPGIDQLTGFKLMIESGHESDLITLGNWYDIEDEFLFEKLIVNRFSPIHVIDEYHLPETRRLYGSAFADPKTVNEFREPPSELLLEFEYDPERFGHLHDEARIIALRWMLKGFSGCSEILEVAIKGKERLWSDVPDGTHGDAKWASQVMEVGMQRTGYETSNFYMLKTLGVENAI
jgi:hypothetical protein